jgi:hypothetical protein
MNSNSKAGGGVCGAAPRGGCGCHRHCVATPLRLRASRQRACSMQRTLKLQHGAHVALRTAGR